MHRSHLRWAARAVCCLSLAACSNPPANSDASTDDVADASLDVATDIVAPPDAPPPPDVMTGPALVACEMTEPDGVPMFEHPASTLVGTLEPMASRLAMPTDISAVTEEGETTARTMGLMGLRRGAGQERVRRTDLGGPMTAPAGERRSIAYFVQFSDTQLVDDESPARLAMLDGTGASGAIRPQEAYLPFAMGAMHRTLDDLQRAERPYQFGIIAGDCADTGQLNELQWFMSVMNGERTHMDSGNDDDPLPGMDNDPKDPFTVPAFPAPWYYVPGNHDVLVVGITVPTEQYQRRVGNERVERHARLLRRWGAPSQGHRGGRHEPPPRDRAPTSRVSSAAGRRCPAPWVTGSR
jgi:hypothetical protein